MSEHDEPRRGRPLTRWEVLGTAPYHQDAGTVVNVGALTMLFLALAGVPYPFLGLLASVPVFIFLAWRQVQEEEAWERFYNFDHHARILEEAIEEYDDGRCEEFDLDDFGSRGK